MLLVPKVDKGNITVILNKQNYLDKMQNLLDDFSTYENWLRSFTEITKNHFQKLDEWRKLNLLRDKIERKNLITINTNLAGMYGLPKVHKDNCPLRPVVSYINSSFYFMAKIFLQHFKVCSKTFFEYKKNPLNLSTKLKIWKFSITTLWYLWT